MQNKKPQELPKWFTAEAYKHGGEVINPYTGDSVELTAAELSMYDLIKGAEMFRDYTTLEKGLNWFRRENPTAYMVLLD